MSNLKRQALVAALVGEMRQAESWCGKTHIQKSVFVFQTLFQPPTQLTAPYILYKHGPYSFELDQDLGEMEFYGGIDRGEQPQYGARYGAGPGTGKLLEKFGQGLDAWMPALTFVAQRVSVKNVRELEALATVLYVSTDGTEQAYAASDATVLARVQALKPHLSELEIERSQSILRQLKQDAADIVYPLAPQAC